MVALCRYRSSMAAKGLLAYGEWAIIARQYKVPITAKPCGHRSGRRSNERP